MEAEVDLAAMEAREAEATEASHQADMEAEEDHPEATEVEEDPEATEDSHQEDMEVRAAEATADNTEANEACLARGFDFEKIGNVDRPLRINSIFIDCILN